MTTRTRDYKQRKLIPAICIGISMSLITANVYATRGVSPITISNIRDGTSGLTSKPNVGSGATIALTYTDGLGCTPGTVLYAHFANAASVILGTCNGTPTQTYKLPSVVATTPGKPIYLTDITPHPLTGTTLPETIRSDPQEIAAIQSEVRSGKRSGTRKMDGTLALNVYTRYLVQSYDVLNLSPTYDWVYAATIELTPEKSDYSIECNTGQPCRATVASTVTANIAAPNVFIDHSLISADEGCSARIANGALGVFSETGPYVYSATYTHDVEVTKGRAGICAITNNISVSVP